MLNMNISRNNYYIILDIRVVFLIQNYPLSSITIA